MNRRPIRSITLLFLGMVIAGCSLSAPRRPSVVIISPPLGSQFSEGEDVSIQATATDSAGISRIELLVDNVAVKSSAPAQPMPSYSATLTWLASAGAHTISVLAYNVSNATSDPATVQVAVIPRGGPAAAPTTVPLLLNTRVPAAVAPGTCTDDAAFVMDVTIPDGTVLRSGQNFDKTWRVRNTGSCAWSSGYQLVFIGGQVMSGTTAFPVPGSAAGATTDLKVGMTAPNRVGTFTSLWRLRNPAGALFGVTLTATIRVAGESTPVSCSGAPTIESFAASSTNITAGQSATLNWGFVSNAQTAEIDNDVGGIATPGSLSVRPEVTTTYTLTAFCGNASTTRQVTINVIPGPTASPAPPTPTRTVPSPTSTAVPER